MIHVTGQLQSMSKFRLDSSFEHSTIYVFVVDLFNGFRRFKDIILKLSIFLSTGCVSTSLKRPHVNKEPLLHVYVMLHVAVVKRYSSYESNVSIDVKSESSTFTTQFID